MIETITVPCPLCGESNAIERLPLNALYRTNGTFIPADIVFEVCLNDGFLHMATRPSDAALEFYYANSIEAILNNNHSNAIGRADFINRFSPINPQGTILDIGCNDGSFLAIMRGLGFTCTGVEPSLRSVRRLADLYPEVEVIPTTIHEAYHTLYTRPRYDLISLFHVLEHLPNIDDTLACLAKLNPHCLFIEVPNGSSTLYPRITKEFGHLSYFTRHTLRTFLERNGFGIIHVEDTDDAGNQSQVLRILARPGYCPPTAVPPPPRISEIANQQIAYNMVLSERIDAFIDSTNGGRIALFGAGTDSYIALNHIELRRRTVAIVDSNPLTHTVPFMDMPVIGIGAVHNIDAILITPRGSVAGIRHDLRNLNIIIGDLEI